MVTFKYHSISTIVLNVEIARDETTPSTKVPSKPHHTIFNSQFSFCMQSILLRVYSISTTYYITPHSRGTQLSAMMSETENSV